jgi:pimeloyl-ACP methyl ester carboxylesterase
MAAELAGARLEVIHDAGHLTPVEQPEAVTDVMKDFLRRLDGWLGG